MLTFKAEESKCFKFIGTETPTKSTKLLSNKTSILDTNNNSDDGSDTCSFYTGPSDSTILSFGESCETSSSVAYAGSETCGAIAYAGGESCGTIASSSISSTCSSSFSGGGCSFSC